MNAKTHPWRVRLLRNVDTIIDGHIILPLGAGERMFRTKRAAIAFKTVMINEHGAGTVSVIFRAGQEPPRPNPPLNALRHHVTGAIERGEATAIVEVSAITTDKT